MQKIAVMLALALGILFPALSQAYVVAPKVGVVMVEIKRGDTFSGICSDLSKKGLLPEKFGAVKCKNAALARNGLTEEDARHIQPGDLYFFPYLPLAEVNRQAKASAATSYAEALNNLKDKLNVVEREKQNALALKEAAKKRGDIILVASWGTFLTLLGIVLILTLVWRKEKKEKETWLPGAVWKMKSPLSGKTYRFKVVSTHLKDYRALKDKIYARLRCEDCGVELDSFPDRTPLEHIERHGREKELGAVVRLASGS